MRVLHVIPSIGPARGGPSMAVRLMARAALAAGIDVDIAATNDNDRDLLDVPLGTPQIEEGVRCFYFQRDVRPYTTSRSLAKWLRQQIGNYDVAHVHALFSFSTTAAAFAARKRGVPYVVRPLGTLAAYGMSQHAVLKRVSWQLFERRILKSAALVHFTSEAERDEAMQLGGDWQSVVLPIGIDVGAYEQTRAAPPNAHFLFMSRLHPKKRLELVLRALAQLPGAILNVAGSGDPDYSRALERLSSQLGLEGRVRWLGHVDGAQKTELLRASSVFVLPSINENFGIAVVEALASGMPVIVSRGVAIHKEIAEAGAGIVVADDVDELRAAMQSLMDVQRVQTCGSAARKLAEEKFSLAAMTDGLRKLYRDAAAA